MNQQAQETYLRMQVNTAAPWELTLMLYNGCIRFMKQALEGLNSSNYEIKNLYIKKSVDIIDELIITLNRNYEISNNLESIYEFMKDKLFEANNKLDANCLVLCVEMMTDLRDTWVESMKKLKSEQHVKS